MKEQHYCTGEEIHIGDRITLAGFAGEIQFVVDRDEFPEVELESREYWLTEQGSGFMVKQDDGIDIFLEEADEDLLFLSRGQPPATDPPRTV